MQCEYSNGRASKVKELGLKSVFNKMKGIFSTYFYMAVFKVNF